MKVRIYEGFAFSLKNNMSRNRGYDIQPRRRERLSFISLSRKIEIIMQRKTNRVVNVVPDSETVSEFVDRESPSRKGREREKTSPPW